MKVETTLALSEEVLRALDQRIVNYQDRSTLVEAALWAFIHRTERNGQAEGDLAILNQHAEELNEEASDVLEYQVQW